MLNLLQGEQKSFLIINMNFTLLIVESSQVQAFWIWDKRLSWRDSELTWPWPGPELDNLLRIKQHIDSEGFLFFYRNTIFICLIFSIWGLNQRKLIKWRTFVFHFTKRNCFSIFRSENIILISLILFHPISVIHIHSYP